MRTNGHPQLAESVPPPVRPLPPIDSPGLIDVRHLPDASFSEAWDAVILDQEEKRRIAQTAAAGFVLRRSISFERLPLHGVVLLVGPPGTGKTTFARGLADRLAQMLSSLGQFAYLEVSPHNLASSSLGRSQQAVQQLFDNTISETAMSGPLVVLIDEVETIATDRGQLSFDANPADVHRAVDAALIGLDSISRRHSDVVFIATSNFPDAIDGALTSRADLVVPIDLPNLKARRAILADTITALAGAFPNACGLLADEVLDEAAEKSVGLDGRRLRKTIVAAAGLSGAATLDPGKVRAEDLLAAIAAATEGAA